MDKDQVLWSGILDTPLSLRVLLKGIGLTQELNNVYWNTRETGEINSLEDNLVQEQLENCVS